MSCFPRGAFFSISPASMKRNLYFFSSLDGGIIWKDAKHFVEQNELRLTNCIPEEINQPKSKNTNLYQFHSYDNQYTIANPYITARYNTSKFIDK